MEVAPAHRLVPVAEASQPSAARYLARTVAESVGFDETDSYRAGLVTTELATNLVKHARGGHILVRAVRTDPGEIEIMAVDRGPGMRDVAAALVDGHSTAGTSGSGLGAVKRLAEQFDIHSAEGRGTVVLARLGQRRALRQVDAPMELAGVSVSKGGEDACGDAWRVRLAGGSVLVAVADGLGHGLLAADAANAAITAFAAASAASPAELLKEMHAAARHTRGLAASVACVTPGARVMTFAGVGNVAGAVVYREAPQRHAVSQAGTLGHEARLFREYSYPWDDGATLIVHTDGLSSSWAKDDLRTLARRHPAIVAAVLYRDHARERDDVTVVVGRARG